MHAQCYTKSAKRRLYWRGQSSIHDVWRDKNRLCSRVRCAHMRKSAHAFLEIIDLNCYSCYVSVGGHHDQEEEDETWATIDTTKKMYDDH